MNFHYIRHTQSSNKVIKQTCVCMAEYKNIWESQVQVYPANKRHHWDGEYQISDLKHCREGAQI